MRADKFGTRQRKKQQAVQRMVSKMSQLMKIKSFLKASHISDDSIKTLPLEQIKELIISRSVNNNGYQYARHNGCFDWPHCRAIYGIEFAEAIELVRLMIQVDEQTPIDGGPVKGFDHE